MCLIVSKCISAHYVYASNTAKFIYPNRDPKDGSFLLGSNIIYFAIFKFSPRFRSVSDCDKNFYNSSESGTKFINSLSMKVLFEWESA